MSLGFDAAEQDLLQAFKVTDAGFAEARRKLTVLQSPTRLVQEGGYLRNFLRAFEGSAT